VRALRGRLCGEGWGRSGAEQSEGDDGDAVRPSVRISAGGDDRLIAETVSELSGEPMEAADIPVADRRGQFHLDGRSSAKTGESASTTI
jgi:hypothetical protein